ncbi:MAG: hypothetical protein LBU86_02810 [Oscillospiraceae bacterium]|jgi:hypothetical protein|nr:hypothetical protein [Oscillospiraceae bacterium]
MINALNMELESIRTVLRNSACEISVAVDRSRDTGTFYTMVAIFSNMAAREIAGRLAVSGAFEQNRDFIGSFTFKDALHLVFTYQPESSLPGKEDIYAGTYEKRRRVALNLLTALAETEVSGDIGKLLLNARNVNLAPDGEVTLNYFLDFGEFVPSGGELGFYRDAAAFALKILAREYEVKYDGQIDSYPHELRLMYKKLQNRAFRSISQIIAFVRELPDKLTEQRFGVMRLAGFFGRIKIFLTKNPANLFLTVIVLVTLGYLGYQLAIRLAAGRRMEENTVYVGMEQIGEVYLGEENI